MQEFIYGPDYVDEHIAVQSAGQTHLVIQDPGYNVVALVDFLGDGLAYQSLQTPYGHFHYIENGAGQTIDTAVHHNATTTGLWYPFWHKGKWFDQEIYSYHYVNRFYPITLGRFAQTDPNGTTLVLNTASLMNGQTPGVFAETSSQAQFADGLNTYASFASNPISRRDPNGLWSFNEITTSLYVKAEVNAIFINAATRGLAGQIARLTGAVLGVGFAYDLATNPETQAIVFSNPNLAIGVGNYFASLAIRSGRTIFGVLRGAQRLLSSAQTLAVPASTILAGVGQKAIIPSVTAANRVAGEWPAAIAPLSGKVYVHSHHSEAIRLAQEGAVTKAGIKSGEVILNEFGVVTSTDWKKSW